MMFVTSVNGNQETWTSDDINVSASASHLRNKINGYFWKYYGANVSITRTDLDFDGSEITDPAQLYQYAFNIKLDKRISG